jgi:CRISPR-associated protein Cmr3
MHYADWKAFRLVPHDVLYFGDGRPSNIGEDHYLRSIFPPFPSTLYGAIRTRRLLDENIDLAKLGHRDSTAMREVWGALDDKLREELGEFGGFGKLELRGPWLEKDKKPVFPAPSDLGLLMKDGKRSGEKTGPPAHEQIREVVRFRIPDDPVEGGFSHPLLPLMPFRQTEKNWDLVSKDQEPESVVGWFLDTEGMKTWAKGNIPAKEHFLSRTELWVDEMRTGVGLQADVRMAMEHELYTFGFIRLCKGVTLGFECRGTHLKSGGALRLGGDGRTANLEQGEALALPEPPNQSGRFALYFATPTLFEGGVYPPGFKKEQLTAKLDGGDCTLRAAAVKSGLPCGGFDMRVREQKPLRHAIPAGSVFLFDGNPTGIHATKLCGYEHEHLAQQGYGLVLTGAIK